ncbi:MAG TPA: alpha-amylase family glycosyl hydrolase [Chitinophagaceae bacterium]|nr:alpha-amylase family glycosyl hydrolase [Chitinophagaceae bacterium]
MNKGLIVIAFLFTALTSFSQSLTLYPANWWVGMKMDHVQVLVHSNNKNFSQAEPHINYPGVTLLQKHVFENGEYMAIDVAISGAAKPGNVTIAFSGNGGSNNTAEWPLQARRQGNGTQYAQGLTSADFIYFLMPDRFSNGDPSNDRVPGMRDQSLNRDSIFLRHGGDLQGIINHLDYIQSLGATALWMTPVIENDMPNRTEHGYAFTDHYKIEPRLGGAEMYKKLSDELHKRGMKLVQDAVYNHVGSYHFMMQNPPSKDWLHQWPRYTNTTYKDQVLFDPYAAASDVKQMSDGWFTPQMPDVNESNPYVQKFLIQHAIWCVEEFGVDAWRIDTYIYNDLDFMNACNAALIAEYPKMFMFGETWVHGVYNQAFFARNNINLAFKSNLPATCDFQTNLHGIIPALTEAFGWTTGVNSLYTVLASDRLYENPYNEVIFLDNHDMSRIFSMVGEKVAKQKMGIEWLLTCRGIPQMYYGTEVLMKGLANPDGNVRLDFPGGWKGDKVNAFTGQGLSDSAKQIQQLVKTLGNYRKNSTALQTGKMTQYVPADGLYVYFRYDEKSTVMCIMNTAENAMTVDFSKYAERTAGFTKAVSVISNDVFNTAENTTIPGTSMWVLELK